MPDMVSISADELQVLRQGAALAQEMSSLRVAVDLIERLRTTLGPESMIGRIARLVHDTVGGSNVVIYRRIDHQFRSVDASGEIRTIDLIDDELVRDAFESGRPVIGQANPKAQTSESAQAETSAIPLIAGDDTVGVLKMEDALMPASEALERLAAFFGCAALVLKNEIDSRARRGQASVGLDATVAFVAQEALRAAHAQLSNIIDFLPDATFVIDENKQVIAWNRAVEEMTGTRKEDILGQGDFAYAIPWYGERRPIVVDLLDEEYAEFRAQYEYVRKQGDTLFAEVFVPAVFGGRGAILWVTASPLLDSQGKRVGAIQSIRDVTERRRAEEALLHSNRELRAITDCNQVLMRAVDEQTLLDDICGIICDEAGYRMTWVGYAEDDDAKTVRPVAWAGDEEGYLAQAGITWADTEHGRGPTGTAIRAGESVCIQDFETDPEAAIWRENASQRGYRSSIALPLNDDSGKTFGALNIYSSEPGAFTPEETRLLEELTGDLAYGITALRNRAERMRAEEALREGEQRFRAIFDQALQFVGVLTVDGRLLQANQTALQFAGVDEGAVLGKPFWETPWWTHSAELQERLRAAVQEAAQGMLVRFEATHVAWDGRVCDLDFSLKPVIDAQGRVTQLITEGRDITERKQAEEALRESEERYRSLIDASPDAIVVYQQGLVVFVNPAAVSLFGGQGYSSSDLVGRKVMDFVHPASREIVGKRMQQMRDEPRPLPPIEETYVCLDGREILVELAVIPFVWQGEPAVQAVARDVTERQHAEDLRIAKEAAEATSVAKSAFLANISHEIRTPLNAILGFSQLMTREQGVSAKQRQQLDIISSSGKHLLALVNDVLEMSKIESGRISLNLTAFDLYALLDELGTLFGAQARKEGVGVSRHSRERRASACRHG